MAGWYRILCPIDFSETSRVALQEAAGLAQRFGAELTLLHVHEPPGPASETLVSPPELFEQAVREMERKLASWKAEAERLSSTTVHTAVVSGPVAAETLRFARENGFDLLVMGTHGRSGLRHLVIGSVAEKVIREAHCPVLVVRPPKRS
jgi:universal stress protein A